VSGVASVQARAPAQRNRWKRVPNLGPDAHKDRSPTVFNLKVGTAKVGKPDDIKARNSVYSLSSSVRYERATPLRA